MPLKLSWACRDLSSSRASVDGAPPVPDRAAGENEPASQFPSAHPYFPSALGPAAHEDHGPNPPGLALLAHPVVRHAGAQQCMRLEPLRLLGLRCD
jgi:hypothetical protein